MCGPAAHVVHLGIFLQQVKILVAAVDEQKLVAALLQPFQLFLFHLVAAPQKAKIPQHDQGILFFQPLYLFFRKTFHLTVDIAGHINQALPPTFHQKNTL